VVTSGVEGEVAVRASHPEAVGLVTEEVEEQDFEEIITVTEEAKATGDLPGMGSREGKAPRLPPFHHT